MSVNRHGNFRRQECDQESSPAVLKYKDCGKYSICGIKNRSCTCNNADNWNRLQMIQKISEQRTRKARNEGTAEISQTGHVLSKLLL